MSMKRIVNQTPTTQIITYGPNEAYNVKLKKFSATGPLPESHEIFSGVSLIRGQSSGRLLVLTDTEYRQTVDALKKRAAAVQTNTKASFTEKVRQRDKEIAAAVEHNKDVETKSKVAALMGKSVSNPDVSQESLVKDASSEKVEVPKAIVSDVKTAPSDGVTRNPLASTPDHSNAEHDDLVKEVVEATKKSKKERRKQAKEEKAAATSEDEESGKSSYEASDEASN